MCSPSLDIKADLGLKVEDVVIWKRVQVSEEGGSAAEWPIDHTFTVRVNRQSSVTRRVVKRKV